MQFTDVDHSFCEESISGLPEYFNVTTTLFFIFFGIYGMMNKNNELVVDLLYANLIIVGIGSFGYHWDGNIGWALLDETPMITISFEIIMYIESVQDLISTSKELHKRNNIMIQKIKALLYLFAMTAIIVLNTMSNYRKIFPVIFTFIILYIFYKIFSLCHNKSAITNKINNTLLTISISGAVWVFTEITCNYVKHSILLLGHPMWHIFVAHGVYNLIQIIYFIKLNHNNSDLVLEYNNFYLLYMKI